MVVPIQDGDTAVRSAESEGDTEVVENEPAVRAGRLSGTHLVVLTEGLPVLSVCLLLLHHYHEH